jgi:hypothetical protein
MHPRGHGLITRKITTLTTLLIVYSTANDPLNIIIRLFLFAMGHGSFYVLIAYVQQITISELRIETGQSNVW